MSVSWKSVLVRWMSVFLVVGMAGAAGAAEIATAPEDSPFGVSNVPLDQPGKIARVTAMGADQMMVAVDPAAFDEAKLRAFLAEAGRQGVRVMVSIPATQAASGAFLQTLAKEAGVEAFVIGPVSEAQARAAAGAAARIRSVSPGAKVAIELDCLEAGAAKAVLAADANLAAIAVPLNGGREAGLKGLDAVVAAVSVPVWSFRVSGPAAADPLQTDGENMRQAVYRSVQALAHGAQKVFWEHLEDQTTGRALYADAGRKMKPSYRACHCLIQRLWPYGSLEAVQEGPEVWAYKFNQSDGQVTTVVWSAPGVRRQNWKSRMTGKFDIGDVCGSLVNVPAAQMLSPEPLYYIENGSPSYKKPTHHGEHLTPWEVHIPYLRCAFPEATAPAGVDVKPGWDWTLPEPVAVSPESGFFNFSEHPSDDIRVIGWHPKWKDWHKGPGQFDFSSVERKLKEAREKNFRVGIRLQSVNRPNVPEWVIEAYHPKESTIPGPLKLRIVAPWDENLRREFESMIVEFGRRGLAKDPAFAFASIHGISEATGEEFGLAEATIRQLERETGLNPENFRAWVLGRLQAWNEAFGKDNFKLAWVGGQSFGFGGYTDVAKDAVKYCIETGIGGRGGFVEMYNYKYNEALMGQSIDEQGYLTVDESRFQNNPCMADENEEYISVKRWRFGLLEEDDHRWRISTLRTLQMRCNYVSTNPMSMDLDRQLTEYARHSYGKTIGTAPDAWAYLREAWIKGGNGESRPMKNLERWLHQRDLPEGMTRPAARVDRSYAMTTDPPGQTHEFDARRTDLASGNKYICFDLDDRFAMSGGGLLKVTYCDDAKAAWAVEYNGAGNAQSRSPAVENRGDGQRKTATFFLPDIEPSNGLPQKQDLRLVCEGPGDLTVSMVRLIRNQP